MRTPNAECCVCGKPLYRRPNEIARVRHVACMEHRNEAQDRAGLTCKMQPQAPGGARGASPAHNVERCFMSSKPKSESVNAVQGGA
jgi:hypothetical protein